MAGRLNDIKKASGAKAVAFCQGMPKGLELFGLVRLANLFGSPNVVGVQDVCHAPREVSGIHTCGFYPVADLHNPCNVIILWASNPMSTNEEGQICTLLLNRIKEGSELIVIDPRKTELAEKAKFWLQPRPGTDHVLALAFLNVILEEGLFDRDFADKWTHGFDDLLAHVKSYSPEKTADITWVPANTVREAARCYAKAHPAAIQWGNPLEQTIHAFDAARALLCLMAVCGNLDVAGGNIQAEDPNILGLGAFVRSDLLPSKPKEMVHAHNKTIPSS
jgi:anaerobic selenocysteine-containing dehydrogenase